MALVLLGVLGAEIAVAAGALVYGLEHLPMPPDDQDPHQDPDSGVAPDDDSPGNPEGGIVPGTEVRFHILGAGPHDTHQSLTMLELRRQWALLRRVWSRTWRHIPLLTVTSLIGLYRGYHIYLSVREAVALRRATIALMQGRGVPHDTPLAVRRMMYLSRIGVNQQVRRGVKRVAGRDPFSTPPPS